MAPSTPRCAPIPALTPTTPRSTTGIAVAGYREARTRAARPPQKKIKRRKGIQKRPETIRQNQKNFNNGSKKNQTAAFKQGQATAAPALTRKSKATITPVSDFVQHPATGLLLG
jgi:hypothetical protein